MRLFSSILTLLLVSCATRPSANQNALEITWIKADLEAKTGSKVKGTASIGQDKMGQIVFAVDATGLSPGRHGIHIHEKGDCSKPDASSAGGHYNPTKKQHGAPSPNSHAGDLGNLIVADDSGNGVLYVVSPWKKTDLNGLIDKSVVIHEKEDDFKSQPAGNSGARVACGVLKKVKELP